MLGIGEVAAARAVWCCEFHELQESDCWAAFAGCVDLPICCVANMVLSLLPSRVHVPAHHRAQAS